MKRLRLTLILLTLATVTYGQKNFIDRSFIETTTVTDTMVVPNMIYISINLNEADSKNKKTLEEQESALKSSLKKLNIATDKDLSLIDFSSNLKNNYPKGQSVVRFKTYSLIVRNTEDVGHLLTELETAGISNVAVDRAEFSEAEELLLDLKVKAVEKSRITAEKLSKTLNQKIGKALYISDTQNINGYTDALQDRAPGMQIRGLPNAYNPRSANPARTDFKKVKFEVEVHVKYELK